MEFRSIAQSEVALQQIHETEVVMKRIRKSCQLAKRRPLADQRLRQTTSPGRHADPNCLPYGA